MLSSLDDIAWLFNLRGSDLNYSPFFIAHALVGLDLPWLRIYGRLDSLVPKAAIPLLDERYPASRSLVLEKASHAPFISHPEPFITLLRQFIG